MDFTREPVIETVITPKEGCKLVIRNSKGVGQEEYFVDAVEVITFGQAIFFRSQERPKPFVVPASDYEVLEVREARIVLKNVGLDRSIKIGGGREGALRPSKENEEKVEGVNIITAPDSGGGQRSEVKQDRKRDRRRQSKRRRDNVETEENNEAAVKEEKGELPRPVFVEEVETVSPPANNSANLAALLAPPPLISETIGRYKEKFKDAFYTKEEQDSKLTLDPGNIPLPSEPLLEPEHLQPSISLEQPAFGAFELSEEAEEEIYRQRRRKFLPDDKMEEESASSDVSDPEAPVIPDKLEE